MKDLIVRDIHEGEEHVWPTHINSMLLKRNETEGIEAFLTVVEAGRFTHPHVHTEKEQIFVVTAGQGKIVYRKDNETEEKEVPVRTGHMIYIPLHTHHQAFGAADKALEYFTIDIYTEGPPQGVPWYESREHGQDDTYTV